MKLHINKVFLLLSLAITSASFGSEIETERFISDTASARLIKACFSSRIHKSSKTSCKTDLASIVYLIHNKQCFINAWRNPIRFNNSLIIGYKDESSDEFEQRKKDLAQAAAQGEEEVNLLEKEYSATFTRCTKTMGKEELYKANRKFAHAQQKRLLKKVYGYVNSNNSISADSEFKEVYAWEKVRTELSKRESE
ncbi:MAG: hypothetical protein ACHQVS_03670 [Candidatus Babeliales bacterium]